MVTDIKSTLREICSKYAELPDDCLEELLTCTRMLVLEKGEQLVKEGQYSDKTFLILEGSMRAYYLKDGKDISDWFAFEHEFVNAINSYFLGRPSEHFIETLESSVVLVFLRDDLDRLCAKHHAMERLARIAITGTMLRLQQRIAAMQFETAQQRYENLLAIRPDITQRAQLSHIASYLGITLETLSRIRRK